MGERWERRVGSQWSEWGGGGGGGRNSDDVVYQKAWRDRGKKVTEIIIIITSTRFRSSSECRRPPLVSFAVVRGDGMGVWRRGCKVLVVDTGGGEESGCGVAEKRDGRDVCPPCHPHTRRPPLGLPSPPSDHHTQHSRCCRTQCPLLPRPLCPPCCPCKHTVSCSSVGTWSSISTISTLSTLVVVVIFVFSPPSSRDWIRRSRLGGVRR